MTDIRTGKTSREALLLLFDFTVVIASARNAYQILQIIVHTPQSKL